MSKPSLVLNPNAVSDRLQTFYAFLPATGHYHAFRGIPTAQPESWWPAPHRGFPACRTREEAADALRYGLEVESK